MDTLLILLGLLLILAGYVWLIARAFERSLFWGLASLLPPLALLFVLIHWRHARSAVALGGLGCIPLVVGLTMLANQDSARLEAILRLEWLKPEPAAKPELAIDLRGELNGQPFVPEQAEFIDGVLSLREGQDFYAHREIQVRLAAPLSGPLRLDVLPDDKGRLPEIEVSWLAPGEELPEAVRLQRGYSLHLDLRPKAPNRMEGVFHLVLPAEMQTTLSGTIEVFTDRLRYRDGAVDNRFDSRDTLRYVLQDYLQRRFARRDVAILHMPTLDPQRVSQVVPLTVEFAGETQDLQVTLEKDPARGWGVRGDRFARLKAASMIAPPAPAPAPVKASAPVQAVPESGRLDLERLLAAPQRYVNRSMRVTTERGRTAEGVFVGLNADGRVVIRRVIDGPGEASYTLRPSEITDIELPAH
ncbi:MFS transporter [Pseudomonas sp. GD04087]|uniref:MFS transporter n=1 Tax=unclassified Pseudomonas TaxID=196821 RepID=UPI002446E3C0|nr:MULTISPECIES: MFS transporter [unclassified Pseudomonas]MDH0288950.1 MFS transporter [Pseudomonas sp. GD04087]MDH1051289.1 MFS transporter [Pseudomonas sp. GD03903]MDH1999185.1 MFS transporter [Pseudomonas sp. GD03691]